MSSFLLVGTLAVSMSSERIGLLLSVLLIGDRVKAIDQDGNPSLVSSYE